MHAYLQTLSQTFKIQYWNSVVHSCHSHTEKSNDAVYLPLKGCGQFTKVERQDMELKRIIERVTTAVVKKAEYLSKLRGWRVAFVLDNRLYQLSGSTGCVNHLP